MGAAAGPSNPRRQQADRRNVVECYNSTDTGRGVAHYVLGAFWVLLVTLWLCAMNAQRLYDTFLAPCPGPVLEPQPRNTPWCVAFARDLAREVAAADARPVRAPGPHGMYVGGRRPGYVWHGLPALAAPAAESCLVNTGGCCRPGIDAELWTQCVSRSSEPLLFQRRLLWLATHCATPARSS
jgi:hypothetical protein